MSFWDGLKAVGGAVVDGLNKQQEKLDKYRDRYEMLDDQELIRKYKNAPNGEARYVCAFLLKERGYTLSDL